MKMPDGYMKTSSLGLENVAFRGTQLKNTEFAYGCAVFTGSDTKMSQNSRMKSNKFSSIEVIMNKYLILFMVILILEIVISTVLKYTIGIGKKKHHALKKYDQFTAFGEVVDQILPQM